MRQIYRYIFIVLGVLLYASTHLWAATAPKDTISSFDYYIEGVREYCSGNLDRAELLMTKAIEKDAENDAAYYYISAIYMQRDQAQTAIPFIERASFLAPDNDWYRLTSARLYSVIGENEAAAGIYEELIARRPKKGSYYYELTDLYARSGQYSKALETLDRIEGASGMNEMTANLRYELLVRDGKYKEAEQVLIEMDRRFPSPQNCLMLGDLYKNRYDDTTALYYYDRALELDPLYSPAYFGKAEIYRMKSDIPGFFENISLFMADAQMNAAWKADYVHQIIFPSGIVPSFRKETDTLIETLLETHPKDTAILSTAAYYFIGVDSIGRGTEILRQNVKYNPTVKSAHNDLMARLYAAQDWDALIETAQNAVTLFPKDLSMQEILAIAYWQDDALDKAMETYKNILASLPSGHPMLINCYASLGDISHAMGNNDDAYKYYKKGLKIDSGYLPILNNYAYFLSVEGKNLKKALEMSRKTVEADPKNYTYLDTYGWLLYLTGDYAGAKKYLKEATLNGGNESAVILDHYAEALFALGEYNLAFLYWGNADKLDPTLDIAKKIAQKRETIKR